jgi:hypothetical protein
VDILKMVGTEAHREMTAEDCRRSIKAFSMLKYLFGGNKRLRHHE